MIDFHCHFLPGIDDGANSAETAYQMLLLSRAQGISTVVATPHFYPTEEDPDEFFARRQKAVQCLSKYYHSLKSMGADEPIPEIYLGAEVYYFPTLSTCSALRRFSFGSQRYLLIEPPMLPWTDTMLDEIQFAGINFGVTPVIAHVDRYVTLLHDPSLFDRVYARGLKIQVNASFFTRKETMHFALSLLSKGRLNMLGSDAHNLVQRPPNIEAAVTTIRRKGLENYLDYFCSL